MENDEQEVFYFSDDYHYHDDLDDYDNGGDLEYAVICVAALFAIVYLILLALTHVR